MSLLAWIHRLVGSDAPKAKRIALRAPSAHVEPSESVDVEPDAALPQPHAPGVGHLDRDGDESETFTAAQEELVARIRARIATGRFGFPLLPTSAIAALAVANRPTAEVRHLVAVVERDPLLTGEMLRIANSAMYSMKFPATSLQQAVMRIGLRSVRSALYSAVMKSDLAQSSVLTVYAEETWRQSQSMARIAKAIGGVLGFEPEQAHVIGLLQDLGKLALLTVLQGEMRSADEITPAVVRRVFREFHEHAGGVMALAWKLPKEMTDVIACHHDFASNTTESRAAALAFLAQQIDLLLSTADDAGYESLASSEVFNALGVADDGRWEILDHARHLWHAAEEALAIRD